MIELINSESVKVLSNQPDANSLIYGGIPLVNVAASDNEAFRIAAANGRLEVVKVLCTRREVNVAAKDNYALRKVCASGMADVVKFLLSLRAVNATDPNCIYQACGFPHIDPACRQNIPIKMAFKNRHFDIVKMLCEEPAVMAVAGRERDERLYYETEAMM